MATYTMEMTLAYARLNPEYPDMGDPEGNQTQRKIASMGGQMVVNAYFTSQDQIRKLVEEGLNLKPMGNDRIKEGSDELGIGQYIKLARGMNDDIREFENKGTTKEVNFGGPVTVIDLTNGPENKKHWDFAEEGIIGNGTKALVQFETYSRGAGVRLKAVGILDLVEYELQERDPNADLLEI